MIRRSEGVVAMPNDDDIVEMEAKSGSKEYVVAYSVREQKRANDLSEKWLFTMRVIFALLIILSIALYLKLDAMNVLTKILTK